MPVNYFIINMLIKVLLILYGIIFNRQNHSGNHDIETAFGKKPEYIYICC